MLKQILQQTLSNRVNGQIMESKDLNDDSDIDNILPLIAKSSDEHDDYRFMLKQLKKRNPKAYAKIVNYE